MFKSETEARIGGGGRENRDNSYINFYNWVDVLTELLPGQFGETVAFNGVVVSHSEELEDIKNHSQRERAEVFLRLYVQKGGSLKNLKNSVVKQFPLSKDRLSDSIESLPAETGFSTERELTFDEQVLVDRLLKLLPSQFTELVYLSNVKAGNLISASNSMLSRAKNFVIFYIDRGGNLEELESLLQK